MAGHTGPRIIFQGELAIISVKSDKQRATLGINFMGGQSWVSCSKEQAQQLIESGAKGSMVQVEAEAYQRDGAWKSGDLLDIKVAKVKAAAA